MPHAAQIDDAAARQRLHQPLVEQMVAPLHFTRDTADPPRLVDLSGQMSFEGTETRVECCCCAHAATLPQVGPARLFDPAQW